MNAELIEALKRIENIIFGKRDISGTDRVILRFIREVLKKAEAA